MGWGIDLARFFRRSSGVQSKLQCLSGSRTNWQSEVLLGLAFLHFDCLRFDRSCAHWLHLVCGGCFLQLYCSQVGFIFIHPLLCLLTYKNKALASTETSRQIYKTQTVTTIQARRQICSKNQVFLLLYHTLLS